MGSSYVGLFGVANDSLCFLPQGTDEKTLKGIESALEVKVVKASIYESSLLAVFAKMNSKHMYLPSYAFPREIEHIEREIKVKIIKTENALGNMIEMNDFGVIVSNTLGKSAFESLKSTSFNCIQMNIAGTDTVGSSLVATNNGFLINPNADKEEIKKIEAALNVSGGSSTANTGDSLVRNSVLANSKGAVVGDMTTGFEMNRIDEALGQQPKKVATVK